LSILIIPHELSILLDHCILLQHPHKWNKIELSVGIFHVSKWFDLKEKSDSELHSNFSFRFCNSSVYFISVFSPPEMNKLYCQSNRLLWNWISKYWYTFSACVPKFREESPPSVKRTTSTRLPNCMTFTSLNVADNESIQWTIDRKVCIEWTGYHVDWQNLLLIYNCL